MTAIDWLLLAAYLVLTLVLGLWLARRNSGEADYFVAGRRLNGWLAGASMAATTFSIDTPLYVAGLVGARGLAGNWEWWSFGLAHVAMAVVFAPLWRRSGVLTDAAFTELRYGGAAAAWLRGIKAFLLAVPVNCIGIGYAFLALRKVVEALGLVSGQPAALGLTDTVWLLMVVALLVMSYTVAGGLWAVVVTDLVQLVLALAGALAVAAAALHAAGGMTALLEQLQALQRPELLSLCPGPGMTRASTGCRAVASASRCSRPTSLCSGGVFAAAMGVASSSSACWPPGMSSRRGWRVGCFWW